MKRNFRPERSAMTRGGVTILVLLGLLGRLVVPVTHTHAYYTLAQHIEHNAVPHVHIGHAAHTHELEHGAHSHDHEDELCQSPNPSFNPAAISAPGQDHDADAVWFPSASGSTFCVKAKSNPAGLYAGAIASLPIANFYSVAIGWRFAACDLRAPSSKLFIILRTLRI